MALAPTLLQTCDILHCEGASIRMSPPSLPILPNLHPPTPIPVTMSRRQRPAPRTGKPLLLVLIATISLLLLVISGPQLAAGAAAQNKIKNVVVLVLENQSFDRVLGCLKAEHPAIDACLPGDTSVECTNPVDPADPRSRRVGVSCDADYFPPGGPGHSIPGIDQQLHGFQTPREPPNMQGFVRDFRDHVDNPALAPTIMQGFNSRKLPAFHTLAKEFLVFDHWHCDIPGPTQPNRLYVNSATSHGLGRNNVASLALGLPQKNLFQVLDEQGNGKVEWRTYFQSAPTTLFFQYTRKHFDRFKTWDQFIVDAKDGNLPAYTYLEPRYFELMDQPGNDMHPDNHAANEADKLLAEIYHILRNSPQWESTAFLVTFDEHGGYFSKVPPPLAPNPDGLMSDDPPYDFSRVGVRVPAILVSPWVRKGAVVSKDRQGRTLSHSSVVKTVRELLLGHSEPSLTRREAWAGSFAHVFDELSRPRTDCPTRLPPTPDSGVRPAWVSSPGYGLMDEFHQSIVILCASLNNHNQTMALEKPVEQFREQEAARYCAQQLNHWFGQNSVEVPPELL